jgi:hypothetical protein
LYFQVIRVCSGRERGGQDCVRLSEEAAEPGFSVATFHWENRCSRDIQVRYVTGIGELSAVLAPLQRLSVPCEGCGRVQTWNAEC